MLLKKDLQNLLAPMELHLMSGNFNRLNDAIEERLTELGIHAEQWSKVLGFQRSKLHGGQYKGGQCVKMLDNNHILESLIMSVTEDEKLKALVESLKELKSVKDSCFGIQLAHDYKQNIEKYIVEYSDRSGCFGKSARTICSYKWIHRPNVGKIPR